MRRSMFKSKLHRVRVTEANLDYEGSVTIDETLMKAADILSYEQVHIWNVNNGNRLQTYAIPGDAGSGVICLNGSAARQAQVGDTIIIATFAEVEAADLERSGWQPTVVHVDEGNQLRDTRFTERARVIAR
jgi:aspartate 1-decarboxylase